jgi:hypothetical protein
MMVGCARQGRRDQVRRALTATAEAGLQEGTAQPPATVTGGPVAAGPSPTPQAATPASTADLPPAAPTATAGAQQPPGGGEGMHFAAMLAVPVDRAYAAYEADIRQAMREIKAAGFDLVGQLFNTDTTQNDWQTFLDVAAEEGLMVTPFVDDPPVWNGNEFDLGVGGELLVAMKDHPALFAYMLIDEPFHAKHRWEITALRMQALYRQAKAIPPNVRMHVGFSREIWKAAQGEYGPNFYFARDMCDICVISTLEFRDYGSGKVFDAETLRANHLSSREIIRREDPDAEIWTTIQVFGSRGTTAGEEGSTYYMPEPAELQQMIDLLFSPELLAASPLDGALFQQWSSRYSNQDRAQLTLNDPEFEELRAIVGQTIQAQGSQ